MSSGIPHLAKFVSNAPIKRLLLGKCHPSKIRNASRIVVKRLEMNTNLKMFFSDHVAYHAHDPQKICKSGDVVLIEELPEKMTRDITHSVVKVVYHFGDITDPITGNKVVGGELREDVEKKEALWGVNEENTFKYDEAPPRGWQEGRRDFSHKEPYRKWVDLPDRDQSESSW